MVRQKSVIMIELPESGMAGLKRGAQVMILETEAGTLTMITVNDDGSIIGELQIDREYLRFVREDSEAIIRKKFAVAGDSFIEVTRGTGKELPENNPYIECYKETEVTEMIALIVSQLQNATVPLIEQVRSTLKAYEAVAKNITDPQGPVQQVLGSTDSLIKQTQGSINDIIGDIAAILANVDQIVDAISNGEGPVAKLLHDPQTGKELSAMIESAHKSMVEFETIAANLKVMSTDLRDEFPGITSQARATMDETLVLMNTLENHWLLSGSAAEPAPDVLPFPEVSP